MHLSDDNLLNRQDFSDATLCQDNIEPLEKYIEFFKSEHRNEGDATPDCE